VPRDLDLAAVDRRSRAFELFTADVAPRLGTSCALSTCHGSPQSDFHLTCGDDDEQRAANFLRAASFVAPAPSHVERSELLLRPLDPRAGGLSHTGGAFFAGREDEGWRRLREFAAEVQRSPPKARDRSRGEAFFGDFVMPVLLGRGCAFEACHSPAGFNDFRLRPGMVGFLSPFALRRNYETALWEFMAIDTPDVRQSRLVKKNLFAAPDGAGITHRGGALLEGPGPAARGPCPPFDPRAPERSSAFCTLKEWHRLEREDHAARLSAPGAGGGLVPLAFVARPPDPDRPVDFDAFRGGAELRLADARLDAEGRVEALENVRPAARPCADLAGRTDLDVRGPEWSADGERLVFSARLGEAGGLDLWLLEPRRGACRRLTHDNGRRDGGVRVHNFDPVFAPDGSLVFASTRAGSLTLKHRLPGSDLWRVGPDLDVARAERMTFLTNAELAPSFMQNGQLVFTAEKASPEFYQLSGRRLNWDLTDYHPLLAQRARSEDTFGMTRPSIGYQQATEIREAHDRNFLFILSSADARGAGGALVVFNRSLGPFEEGREDATFLKALRLPDAAAHGRPGTMGVYRSPAPLPNGEILASYAGNVREPARDVPRYDLVAVDDATGARRVLLPGGTLSLVEATLGLKRSARLLFRNVPQLVFGGHAGDGDRATVHFPDLPLLATLLDANLRRGRNVAAFEAARALGVYESLPPPSAAPDPALVKGAERVYTERRLLGRVPLEPDGSVKVVLPARKALVLELLDARGAPLFTMREEHQLGPGESISPGVPRRLFDGVCGGCHGSVSGRELDVAVTPDALTAASVSMSRDRPAKILAP
jgi:hypothetical protein